ncbi:hypothetical protein T08_5624 [Trichinella sp. T8]|nr:hypothetical protein T08_5624 [Trichinella sp. T8]
MHLFLTIGKFFQICPNCWLRSPDSSNYSQSTAFVTAVKVQYFRLVQIVKQLSSGKRSEKRTLMQTRYYPTMTFDLYMPYSMGTSKVV